LGAISNFYENWWIYLQLDIGDKLFTGVNDNSGKTVGQILVCLHHEMNVLDKSF
jgi:hypothetical protein